MSDSSVHGDELILFLITGSLSRTAGSAVSEMAAAYWLLKVCATGHRSYTSV